MPKVVKTTPWNKIKAEYLQGVTPKELAKKYGLTAKQVSDKASREDWVIEKSKINEKTRENIQDRMMQYSNDIVDRLYQIAIDKNEKTCDRINAGKIIVELSGLKNTKQEEKAELPTININGVKI